MHLSMKKAVKYSTIFIVCAILILWVGNTKSVLNSRNVKFFHDDKVLKSFQEVSNNDDKGVYYFHETNAISRNVRESSDLRILQRSSRSLSSNDASSVSSQTSMQQVAPGLKISRDNKLKRGRPNGSKANQTELDDIFITVKTSLKYHESRVKLILDTWHELAPHHTYFFTDGEDPNLKKMLGDRLINTHCPQGHLRDALTCKMGVEFDAYMVSRKRWFCHMDDDMYVNIPRLVRMLRKYNHKEDWYLGKPSLKYPLEIMDRKNPGTRISFWFGTGGAGICISRSLALKMMPYAGGGRFKRVSSDIRSTDDCTIGYIVDYLLKNQLTVIPEFHSHLENLHLIKKEKIKNQITYSYSKYPARDNVINLPGYYNTTEDWTRFKSLHCHLGYRICDEYLSAGTRP